MDFKKLNLPNLFKSSKIGEDISNNYTDNGLSPKRKYRVTGSNYDKIGFVEVRHEKGSKVTKGDMLEWLKMSDQWHLVYEVMKKHETSDAMSLKATQIKEVYFRSEPITKPTKTCLSYLKTLIGYHLCSNAKERLEVSSKATDHGKKYEPYLLKEFDKWFIGEYGNDYRVEKDQQFYINPNNDLLGSTADALIYFGACEKPDYAVEGKCPMNPLYHAAKFMSDDLVPLHDKLDKRYTKQRLGYFVNIPTIDSVFFTSYEHYCPHEEFKLSVIELKREDYRQEIESLRNELNMFCDIYLGQLEYMGLTLDLQY